MSSSLSYILCSMFFREVWFMGKISFKDQQKSRSLESFFDEVVDDA